MKKIGIFILGCSMLMGVTGLKAQEQFSIPFNESVWHIEHLRGQKGFIEHYQSDQKSAYVSFNPYTHQIRGSGLCNKFLGFFQNDKSQLIINKIEQQKNVCLDSQVNQQDGRFFDYLRQVRSYTVSGKILKLKDSQNKVLITAKYFR